MLGIIGRKKIRKRLTRKKKNDNMSDGGNINNGS